ncbi:hypothetical protein I305_06614 [Cryptococcus gattii E566]|nr:hypothetical protein I305_06614 [Cryptococcus gattii E566]
MLFLTQRVKELTLRVPQPLPTPPSSFFKREGRLDTRQLLLQKRDPRQALLSGFSSLIMTWNELIFPCRTARLFARSMRRLWGLEGPQQQPEGGGVLSTCFSTPMTTGSRGNRPDFLQAPRIWREVVVSRHALWCQPQKYDYYKRVVTLHLLSTT